MINNLLSSPLLGVLALASEGEAVLVSRFGFRCPGNRIFVRGALNADTQCIEPNLAF